MLPEIRTQEEINAGQSAVYLTLAEFFPAGIPLTNPEQDYARKHFSDSDGIIHINSYSRSTFIIKVREDLPHWRVLEEIRMTACEVAETARRLNLAELVVSSVNVAADCIEAFAEGYLLTTYTFDRYKTTQNDKKGRYPASLVLHGAASKFNISWIAETAAAVWQSRDLINEPVISMNAASLARAIVSLGEHKGFRTEVLGRSRIESLKMGGLLAVNRGSIDPPAFIIAEWKPDDHRNEKPLVLVGKGVVFDTGGMSLKTGTSMEGMKSDMAGAAAVAGAMAAIAGSGMPLHVVALIPVTDNRVTGNALVPGDIITMYNGKTVEVINTDAEGRLILADALSYAGLFDPMLVVSIATLTGSASATFGNHASAMMGNASEEMFSLLSESGLDVYERVARLPFWHEYGDAMKSDIADLKNLDSRDGGAIKAGKFLENFVAAPYIHLDIAGPGYLKKDDHYRKKEGPAFGVRLLAAFCKKLVSQTE